MTGGLGGGWQSDGGGGGGGTITGSGTVNRISKFITPTSIGDSIGFDNGVSIGYGTITPNASALIDISSTSKGFLLPRMTTAQRNAIGATAVGLQIYNTDNNTFNYWDGGAWRTLDTNVGDYMNGGNAFGGDATIGLTDNFNLSFKTNNAVSGLIDKTGLWAIGSATTIAGARLAISGTGTSNTTYSLRIFNSAPLEIYSVRNDGYILSGLANGSMTIGLNSGFDSSLAENTFIGVSQAVGLTTGTLNTAIGYSAMHRATTALANVAVGDGALNNGVGIAGNVAVGFSSLMSLSSEIFNTAIGHQSGANSTGNRNTFIGGFCSFTGSSGDENTMIGYRSGFAGGTLSGSVFLGAFSGYYETSSNYFYLNNQDRANLTNERNTSLMYGKFNAAIGNQFVVLNGVLYMKDTAAPNHYWSIVNTGGVFVFTDTGSANAPT